MDTLDSFPLSEFTTLANALCTWAVEYLKRDSGEIAYPDACAVVERAFPGGWHRFCHDWEKARRVGVFARERFTSVGLVDDGEEKRSYQEIDLDGLFCFACAENMKGGGRVQHRRANRCNELRGVRAALALLRQAGLMPRVCHSDYSPTGRWFHSSTDVLSVRGGRALVQIVSMLDC